MAEERNLTWGRVGVFTGLKVLMGTEEGDGCRDPAYPSR